MVTHIAHIGWGMPAQGLSTMALPSMPFSGNGAASPPPAPTAGLFGGPCNPSHPAQQPRQSIFDRFWRNRYSRDLAAAVSVERQAAGAFDAGNRDDAARLFLEAGGMYWTLSQNMRAGLWRTAEHAYVKGSLIAMGMLPDPQAMQDRAIWLDVASSLVEKKILKENVYAGASQGDDHIVTWTVGMGRSTTVYKIFGRRLVLKIFDGGANNYMYHSHFPPLWMMDLAREKLRVVHGLRRMSEAGLATAPTIYDGDHFMIQGLIEGPTKEFVRTVLPWDEMAHALSSFDEYVGGMRAAGLLSDFDGNFEGNVLFERKTRRWMAVDF